jgi:raffinose/stachyose/melibiose transport system permease protein
MVIPWIVMIMVWRFIYDPSMGIINSVLRALGLDSLTQIWLADRTLALWCIALFGFPWVAGFNLLIYLAGLDNINEELFDAAAMDGATGLRRMLAVDFPLIMGQIKLILVMTTITQIQNFQDVLLLTNGGPGRATFVPGLVLYRSAFFYNKMGYASAIGVLMFIVILGLTILNMRFLRTETEYQP